MTRFAVLGAADARRTFAAPTPARPPKRAQKGAQAEQSAPPTETPSVLGPVVRGVLRRTPPAAWSYLLLVTDAEGEPRVMSRGDAAAWLRSSDLDELAHEALARRVPRGALLHLRLGLAGPAWSIVRFADRAAR